MINERGITLLEVLVVLLLSSVILITVTMLITQSNKEHAKQFEENKEIVETSYILKLITADIRESIQITSENDKIILTKHKKDPSTNINDKVSYLYDEDSTTLYRNNAVISNTLESFVIHNTNNSVNIQIKNVNEELIQTTIYLRGD